MDTPLFWNKTKEKRRNWIERNGSDDMKYLLTAVYLIFTTSGIFLFKAGGDSLHLSFVKGIDFKMGYITLAGFACYVISFLLWQKLLITYDLSYIVPITTGISQIIILLMGIIFFSEQIRWTGILGVFCIIGGVMLIAVGKR